MSGQKGLTLVDIAVALVVIGLLLGGVLKGRDLIQGAGSSSNSSSVSPFVAPSQLPSGGKYGKTSPAASAALV